MLCRGYNGPPPSSIRPVGQTPGSQVLQALRRAKLHKNPRVLGVGFLWLFGLFAVFLSPAPVRITDQKMDNYEKRLKILADTDVPRQAAQQNWLEAELEVRKAKVSTTQRAKQTKFSEFSGDGALPKITLPCSNSAWESSIHRTWLRYPDSNCSLQG